MAEEKEGWVWTGISIDRKGVDIFRGTSATTNKEGLLAAAAPKMFLALVVAQQILRTETSRGGCALVDEAIAAAEGKQGG